MKVKRISQTTIQISKFLMFSVLSVSMAENAFASSYIVKFKGDQKSFANFSSQKSLANGNVVDKHAPGKIVLVDFANKSSEDLAASLAELYSNPDVEYVAENKKLHTLAMPNDTDIAKQWTHAKINSSKAWTKGVGSKDVVIAVVDTGVDYNHPDLADNIWTNPKEIPGNGIDDDGNGYVDDVHGYDFNQTDADPMDETGSANPGHGTHCSGIMGGVGDNNRGISGISQKLSVMAVRFLGADGSGETMGAIKSIDYATENGARVISASWGGAMSGDDAKPITDAISRANDKGVIFIAAASNDGQNNDSVEMYPANTPLPNVISVAASNETDKKPSWSNFGLAKVHVAAPGNEIWSTLPGNKYGNLSGTSMATPLVSGLVGLMLSHNKNLTGPEVKALLQVTGSKVAIETACECRIDADAAVTRVLANSLTILPQALTLNPTQTEQFSAFGGSGGYKYTSSADTIATIDENGLLTAVATGEVEVTVTDSSGATNSSMRIRVVEAGSTGGGGGGGGGSAECPATPEVCDLMCKLIPTLPWCTTAF